MFVGQFVSYVPLIVWILRSVGHRNWILRYLHPKSLRFLLVNLSMIADDPHEKIKLKMFHCEIQNDTEKLNAEAKEYKNILKVSDVTPQQVMDNYFQVSWIYGH